MKFRRKGQDHRRQQGRNPRLSTGKQPFFQYSSNRSQVDRPQNRSEHYEDPQDVRPSRLAMSLRRLPIIVGVLGCIGIVLLLSSLSGNPKVELVNGSSPVRDNAPYVQTAAEAASGVGSHSKWLLDRQKITDELAKQYPELRNIRVVTPLFANHAVVKAETSQPVLVLRMDSGAYLIGERGIALFDLHQTQSAAPVDSLLVVNDQSNAPVQVGKSALTTAQVAYIREIKHQSDEKQLVIETADLTAGGGELQVRYQGQPYYVKFNIYGDARKSFGTFFATKEFIDGGGAKPAEYVDVRIPERAYVK